ncbi:hypothetical protein EYF80_011211 [Liparis tanakae]|uniref:Uncharacterized protein n=1 Tax=Liparis tanakae TaxID=230148 RepID=A0A4Z2IL27_9TELE|nr:hypothetical protein EYF80_011211 [Liparis tanakae]
MRPDVQPKMHKDTPHTLGGAYCAPPGWGSSSFFPRLVQCRVGEGGGGSRAKTPEPQEQTLNAREVTVTLVLRFKSLHCIGRVGSARRRSPRRQRSRGIVCRGLLLIIDRRDSGRGSTLALSTPRRSIGITLGRNLKKDILKPQQLA